MRGFHKAHRATQNKLILICAFLLGMVCFISGTVDADFLYNVFNADIFKFMFGIYVFSGFFLVLVSNLYLMISGHGLVPMRGSLQKTPPLVQVSYRYFYRPIVFGAVFLMGGALGTALF